MVLRATEFFSKKGASACDLAAEFGLLFCAKMRNGMFKFTQPYRFSELERLAFSRPPRGGCCVPGQES